MHTCYKLLKAAPISRLPANSRSINPAEEELLIQAPSRAQTDTNLQPAVRYT